MLIFKRNSSGANGCLMKLYNCTIYQNNTLVRKLIPSKDGSTICLWDEVSETYYKNAGSGGNFSGTIAAAKMAKKIYIGVNNVAKKVKKGYIGVNGVAKLFYLSEAGQPTITVTDYNTFSYTASNAVAYYVSTSSTKPSAGASQSSFALNKWVTAKSTNNLSLSSGTTYYVWAESSTTDGVSSSYRSITTRKITRSKGTGTTLTTKYDSSSGTPFTTTSYVLNGAKVYVEAALSSSSYINLVLTKNGTSISSGTTHTITADTTFASSATALSTKSLSGTPVTVQRNAETKNFSFGGTYRIYRVVFVLHNEFTSSVYLTSGSTVSSSIGGWATRLTSDDITETFSVSDTNKWTGIRVKANALGNSESYIIKSITIYYTT